MTHLLKKHIKDRCCWFKELMGQRPYWESKMVEFIQIEIKLPGQPTFSWLHLWWDSWNNPGECLHPQCSMWGCPDTEQQWPKQRTFCVRVVQNVRTFYFNVRGCQMNLSIKVHTHTISTCSVFDFVKRCKCCKQQTYLNLLNLSLSASNMCLMLRFRAWAVYQSCSFWKLGSWVSPMLFREGVLAVLRCAQLSELSGIK